MRSILFQPLVVNLAAFLLLDIFINLIDWSYLALTGFGVNHPFYLWNDTFPSLSWDIIAVLTYGFRMCCTIWYSSLKNKAVVSNSGPGPWSPPVYIANRGFLHLSSLIHITFTVTMSAGSKITLNSSFQIPAIGLGKSHKQIVHFPR